MNNPKRILDKHTGLKRLCFAFINSLHGLNAGIRHESALRQEFIIFVVLMPVVFLINFSGLERLALIASVLAVIVVELLNSAIEATLDRVSTEWHPLTKRAKDYGSLAVLLTLIIAVATWALLLWPKII
ncbi:MAG: diacylglycerol kinase [Methylophaga sp.]